MNEPRERSEEARYLEGDHPQAIEEERERQERESYERYVASLEPCPGCGLVDEMDNITGQILCAACSLDEMSVDEDDDWAEADDR